MDSLDISWSSKHTELSTTSSPGNRLAADSGVVDQGSGLDNTDVALSGLGVLREAPRVDLAISGYSEGVVGAGSDERCLGYV